MCWSGEASAVLATIGLTTAAYSAYKKVPAPLWITLAYFSLMELLQAFTYAVINECSLQSNQILTLLGYIHICFQPFFVNLVSLYFLPAAKRKKVAATAYTICGIASAVMLSQLFHFTDAGHCMPGSPMCAEILCSVSGNWHIAWDVPLNGIGTPITIGDTTYNIGAYLWAYLIAAFIMPLAYGVWRGTIFHFLFGPFLAWLTTDNMNEWPAVWCLLSIGIVMLILKVRANPVLSEKLLRIRPRTDTTE